jgi:hypothetical protein
MTVRDGVGVRSPFSSFDAGVESNVELLDLPPSSGLSEKSFAITLHIELSSLPTDLFELEAEPLLFGEKTPVLFLSFFSTKASKPVEPIMAALSLFGFHVPGSFVVGSGLSWIVSWTTSRSSESRPTSETLPNREGRDFPPLDRVMMASILSLLSSSRGVWIVEKLDAVIVGDKAGQLDLVVNECMLRDLPRVTPSVFCLTSLVVRLMTIGGGRLFSRGDGVEGSSNRLSDEERGESGRGTLSGSTVSTKGTEGSCFSVSCSVTSSSGMSGEERAPGIEESGTGLAGVSNV